MTPSIEQIIKERLMDSYGISLSTASFMARDIEDDISAYYSLEKRPRLDGPNVSDLVLDFAKQHIETMRRAG